MEARPRDPLPAVPKPESLGDDGAARSLPAYSVIQQQLIDARDRLDREVARLTRMHAFNARALRLAADADFIPALAEAIVDIFELEFGLCWLLDETGAILHPIGVLGIQADMAHFQEGGERLAARLAQMPGAQAVVLTAEAMAEIAPCAPIAQAVCAPCRDAEGRTLALLMGGNTTFGAGFFEAATPELCEAFGLFAQQMGALIENRTGRATIERQMEEIRRADQRLHLALDSNRAGLWDLDLASGAIELSSGWASLIGAEPRNTVTPFEAWIARVPLEDQTELRSKLARIQGNSQDMFEAVHRLRQQDGSLLWVLSRGYTLRDGAGKPAHVVGTTFDSTTWATP